MVNHMTEELPVWGDDASVKRQKATPLADALDAQRINRLALFDVPGHKGGRMNPELPVFFISGDMDPVGENGKGVIRVYNSFLKAGMTDVTMKLYHGGRHEMLNEINSAEVYQDILYWLNSKTGC